MAGESAQWRTTANTIFASFGDVVRAAIVSVESDSAVYDSSTGTMVKTTTNTGTQVVLVVFNFKLFGKEKYQDEDRTYMVRGSDFSSRVKPGSLLKVYAEDGTTIEGTFVVIQNETDDSGTGAYFYLHVRRAGRTS